MSGYFMVRRSSIAGATLNPVGYKILLEVIGRGKVREIAEVGYVFCERVKGESKVTSKQYIDYIHHLVRLGWQQEGWEKSVNASISLLVDFSVLAWWDSVEYL
jgi:hypothetical protein